MKRIFILYIVLLIFIIPSVFAETTYTQSGGDDTYYRQGRGIFDDDSELLQLNIDSVPLFDEGKGIPLVDDLDGDGSNEIVFIDGFLVRIFVGSHNLTIEKPSFDMSYSQPTRLSNMIIFDIDGDGKKEIIIATEDGDSNKPYIHIIEHNGTHTYNQSSLYGLQTLGSDRQVTLGCRAVNQCIAMVTGDRDVGGGVGSTKINSFNSTSLKTTNHLSISLAGGNAGDNLCTPRIRHITVADYDNDGKEEFIASQFEGGISTSEKLHIYYMDINSSGDLIMEHHLDTDDCGFLCTMESWSGGNCGGVIDTYITSPLVYNFWEGSGNEWMETVVGVNVRDDEYKLLIYKYNGEDIVWHDDHPEVYHADGIMISNVVKTRIWDEGSVLLEDYCVMGYQTTEETISLLCGRSRSGSGTSSREFKFSTAGMYNISTADIDKWNIITHSAEMKSGSANLQEIINSYGVFEINWVDIYESKWNGQAWEDVYTLDRIWANPNQDGALISVDVEQVDIPDGREDLLFLTDNNLYYYDDGISNSAGYISKYSIEPCINEGAWKVNTSVEIKITVEDVDNNDIQARATLYLGRANEMVSGFEYNYSAGTQDIPFIFIANATTNGDTLRMEGRDVKNLGIIHNIDIPYSVGLTGWVHGDCITEVDVEPPDDDDEIITCVTDEDCGSDESCIGGVCVDDEDTLPVLAMKEASEVFNIGITPLWLMFMMALAIGFWFAPIGRNNDFFDSANARFGIIIVGEIFMLILGTMFGFLPLAIILTIVILGLIAFSVWIVRKFTGTPA